MKNALRIVLALTLVVMISMAPSIAPEAHAAQGALQVKSTTAVDIEVCDSNQSNCQYGYGTSVVFAVTIGQTYIISNSGNMNVINRYICCAWQTVWVN